MWCDSALCNGVDIQQKAIVGRPSKVESFLQSSFVPFISLSSECTLFPSSPLLYPLQGGFYHVLLYNPFSVSLIPMCAHPSFTSFRRLSSGYDADLLVHRFESKTNQTFFGSAYCHKCTYEDSGHVEDSSSHIRRYVPSTGLQQSRKMPDLCKASGVIHEQTI